MTDPRPQPAPARARLAGLDGLRGLAVIAVIVYHVFPGALQGGFLGVDVFFVISGFLITSLLVEERLRTGRVSLRRFWGRRARRLLPALAVVLVVCSSIALLIGGDVLYGLPRELLGATTFTSNWLDIVAGQSYFAAAVPELFRPMWSLAVEEQFYLVWPALLLALLLVRRPRVRLALVGAAAAASGVLMAAGYSQGADPTRIYFGTDTHSLGLMIGAFLALSLRELRPLDLHAGETAAQRFVRTLLVPCGFAALVLLVVASFTLSDSGALAYRGGLFVVSAATAVLVWAAVTPGSAVGRMLDFSVLRWTGERSYALYLWHWPVYVLMTSALPQLTAPSSESGQHSAFPGVMTIAIATALAALSFRYLEDPIRRNGLRGLTLRAVERSRSSARVRRELVAGLAAAALALGATTTALVIAPTRTSAQVAVERGEQAIAAADTGVGTGTGSTGTAGASPGGTGVASPPSARARPRSTSRTWTVASRTAPSGAEIDAIGDSVMLASAPQLLQAFPGISIDAKVSRQMFTAPQLVEALASTKRLRPVLILGLGTNGSVTAAELDQIRRFIGPSRLLVLLTLQAPRAWIPGDNAVLAAYAKAHPQNVLLVDWAAAIARHLDLLAPDEIHPGSAGGAIYATAIGRALKGFVAANRPASAPVSP